MLLNLANTFNNRSPFFDVTCAPIKPVARLHILKQREYKKVCAEDNMLYCTVLYCTVLYCTVLYCTVL